MIKDKHIGPYFYLSLLLMGGCIHNSNAALDQETIQKIDDFMEAVMGCRNMVGMNLAIVQDGETVLKKGYGVKNLDTKEPVTEHTLFSLASLTKAFADTILGKALKEKGYVFLKLPLVHNILGRK